MEMGVFPGGLRKITSPLLEFWSTKTSKADFKTNTHKNHSKSNKICKTKLCLLGEGPVVQGQAMFLDQYIY